MAEQTVGSNGSTGQQAPAADQKTEQRAADRAAQVEKNKAEQNAAKVGVDLALLAGKVVEFEPKSATEMWLLAQYFFAAKNALPAKLGGVGDVFLTLMAGKSLGLDSITALRGVSVVEGTIFIGADLMHAILNANLKREDGDWVELLESTDKIATYEWNRKGWKAPKKGSFTIEEATRAGLISSKEKSAWNTYRPAMLRHRALAIWAREFFPEKFQRVYTTDEREEIEQREVNDRPDGPHIPATSAPTVIDAKPKAQPDVLMKAELPAAKPLERIEEPKPAETVAAQQQAAETEQTAKSAETETAAKTPATQTDEEKAIETAGNADGPDAFVRALAQIQNLPKPQQVEPLISLARSIDLFLGKPGNQPTHDLGKMMLRIVGAVPEADDRRDALRKVYGRHKWMKGGA